MKNNYSFKKITSLLLTVILLLSVVGCTSNKEQPASQDKAEVTDAVVNEKENNKDTEEDEKETTDSDENSEQTEDFENSADSDDLENKIPTKEEADAAIRKIIEMEFETDSDDFIDYDVCWLVENEFEALEKDNYLEKCDTTKRPIDYSWYDNGVIDQEKLYEKIVRKTKLMGIRITPEIEKIAREVPKASQAIVTYLLEEHPDFSLNQALYYLDRIYVDTTDVEYAVGMYYIGGDQLCVNFDNVQDQQDFEKVVTHELFHMFLVKTCGDPIYAGSTCYDSMRTSESPITQVYLEEWYVEYFACSAIEFEPDHLWTVREKLIVDILCASAGVDYTYFEKVALGLDDEKLLNAVEPELRSREFVYSTLHALDLGNDYSTVPWGYDEDELRQACLNYALFNIYKNAFVRNMKAVANGELTYEPALADIELLDEAVWQVYGYELDESLANQILEMRKTFVDFCSQYK